MSNNTKAPRANLAAQSKAQMAKAALKGALEAADGIALRAALEAFAKGATAPSAAPVAVATGVGGFALDAGDNYRAHPLTRRDENGKLVPHVADPKQRAKLAATKAPDGKGMGVNKAYTRGKTANTARAGTYRAYLLEVVLGHSDTHSAMRAYAARPWPDNRPLDAHCFNWCANKGYIQWAS